MVFFNSRKEALKQFNFQILVQKSRVKSVIPVKQYFIFQNPLFFVTAEEKSPKDFFFLFR